MCELKRLIFLGSFKRAAAERVASSGMTLSVIANELGAHAMVLRK